MKLDRVTDGTNSLPSTHHVLFCTQILTRWNSPIGVLFIFILSSPDLINVWSSFIKFWSFLSSKCLVSFHNVQINCWLDCALNLMSKLIRDPPLAYLTFGRARGLIEHFSPICRCWSELAQISWETALWASSGLIEIWSHYTESYHFLVIIRVVSVHFTDRALIGFSSFMGLPQPDIF